MCLLLEVLIRMAMGNRIDQFGPTRKFFGAPYFCPCEDGMHPLAGWRSAAYTNVPTYFWHGFKLYVGKL